MIIKSRSVSLWLKAADQVIKEGLLRRLPIGNTEPSPRSSAAALGSHRRNAFPRKFWLRFSFLFLYCLISFLHILNHSLCWGGWWCRQLCFDKLQVVHYPLFRLHKRVPIPFVPWAHHRGDICVWLDSHRSLRLLWCNPH